VSEDVQALVERVRRGYSAKTNTPSFRDGLAALGSLTAALEGALAREADQRAGAIYEKDRADTAYAKLHVATAARDEHKRQRERNFDSIARLDAEREAAEARAQKAEAVVEAAREADRHFAEELPPAGTPWRPVRAALAAYDESPTGEGGVT
jgi:hypothetical protein